MAGAAKRLGSIAHPQNMKRMKQKLLLLNHSILFLGVSIYFGTGWSTFLFDFPVVPKLNVGNYYLHFVPQVAAATKFFTVLVPVMIATGIVMAVAEWRTRLRWVPIVVVLAIASASFVTMHFVFPLNKLMAKPITDPQELAEVMGKWLSFTRIRISLWSLEWLSLMYYFAARCNPPQTIQEKRL
jgi:hypothetical protein